MMNVEKILICDDHLLFGDALLQLLSKNGYEVEFVFTSSECLVRLKNQKFDYFLCDLNIDNLSGFELIEKAKPWLAETKIILISAYSEQYLIDKAKKCGLHGYFDKSISAEKLLNAMRKSDATAFHSLPEHKSESFIYPENNHFSPSKFLLSNQEKEIIKWIVFGLTSKKIGEKLFISKHTVDTHRRNINKKLEIHGISSLIRFAHENNLVD